MWYALAAVLAAVLLRPVDQASYTTLRLHVVDGQDKGVELLRVTLEDAEGASHTVITDAAGQAVVGPLPGTIVFVRAAQLAQRLDLTVEPTTATEGMRLGLIAEHERTVRLIAADGRLFLDPAELFRTPDPDAAAAPSLAPLAPTPPAPPAAVLRAANVVPTATAPRSAVGAPLAEALVAVPALSHIQWLSVGFALAGTIVLLLLGSRMGRR